jgi:hypothetical protein
MRQGTFRWSNFDRPPANILVQPNFDRNAFQTFGWPKFDWNTGLAGKTEFRLNGPWALVWPEFRCQMHIAKSKWRLKMGLHRGIGFLNFLSYRCRWLDRFCYILQYLNGFDAPQYLMHTRNQTNPTKLDKQ